MTRRTASPRRAAFTLVEVLIVVVIIALLASLLLVAITRVGKAGATATAANDISQLSAACEQFKQDWSFFPPSGLVVVDPTTGTQKTVYFRIPTAVPLDSPTTLQQAQEKASFELYKRKYPRWLAGASPGFNTGLAGQGLELNGNQAMVYFLSGPTQTGWTTDAPIAPTPSATAFTKPYFDFKTDRLAPGNTFGAPSAAVVYLDPFSTPPAAPNGTPYAYLASLSPGGKYPPHNPTTNITCFGVAPFAETTNNPAAGVGFVVKYMNQGGVQIISAGEDGKFGPGCPLVGTKQCRYVAGQSDTANPVDPKSPYAEGDDGANDLANFNNGNKLGVGR